MQHGAAERESLLPSAGKGAGETGFAAAQPSHLECPIDAPAQLRRRHAVHARIEAQVFEDGQIGVERKLLRHVADVAADQFGCLDDVVTGDRGAAGGGMQQSAQNSNRGRFSRTVGSEKSKDFAGARLKRNAIDGGEIAETLDQVFDFNRNAVRARHAATRVESLRTASTKRSSMLGVARTISSNGISPARNRALRSGMRRSASSTNKWTASPTSTALETPSAAVSSSRTRRASDDTIDTTAPWSRDLRRAGVSQKSSRP